MSTTPYSKRYLDVFGTSSGRLKWDPEKDGPQSINRVGTGRAAFPGLIVDLDSYRETYIKRRGSPESDNRGLTITSLGRLCCDEGHLEIDDETAEPGISVVIDNNGTDTYRYSLFDNGQMVEEPWRPHAEGGEGEYPGSFGEPTPVSHLKELFLRQLVDIVLNDAEQSTTDWLGVVTGNPYDW